MKLQTRENFHAPRRLNTRQNVARERFLSVTSASRPQPDEFYPKPPPTEPVPTMPIPPETPLPSTPPGAPSSLPEQPPEPDKPVIHPMLPPEVP
jgi:hypothetical protein